jgi:tRNA nucleotidyltransferase (CCA-adding enzyme)
MVPLPADVRLEVMDRLRVRKATREDVVSVSRALEALDALPEDAKPSQVTKALKPFLPRVLAVARVALGDGPGSHLIHRYFSEWRLVRCEISGEDLRQAGLKPGPQYAVILDRLLAARLDGEIGSESEERALLGEILTAEEAEVSPSGRG